MRDDPYEILQVSPNAEQEVIEAAYRRLARKYHPDVSADPAATARMQKINLAYETLHDPAARAKYDYLARLRRQSASVSPDRPVDSRQPQPPTQEGQATSASPGQSAPAAAPTLQPRAAATVLIAAGLLIGYNLAAWLLESAMPSLSPTMNWLFVALGFGMSVLVAVAAAAGWEPVKIAVWRVVLMLLLTFLPILVWIPSYFAGKAIARKVTKGQAGRQSRALPVVYGIGSILLALFVANRPPAPLTFDQTEIRYSTFANSDAAIRFDHPSFLSPETEITQERTDIGTIFTVTDIRAESANPSVMLLVRILHDPTRNQMFPALYPPDADSMKVLVMGDVADLTFTEPQLTQEEALSAVEAADTSPLAGYPAAQYTLRPRDTAIGDAIVRGALIVTDERDVSLYLIASVEPGVDGSLSPAAVDDIWERLLSTLVLER